MNGKISSQRWFCLAVPVTDRAAQRPPFKADPDCRRHAARSEPGGSSLGGRETDFAGSVIVDPKFVADHQSRDIEQAEEDRARVDSADRIAKREPIGTSCIYPVDGNQSSNGF